MSQYLFILLLNLPFFVTHAQTKTPSPDSAKLIHKDSLIKYIPESVGHYKFDQISIPPFFSDPPKQTIVNALYVSEDNKSFFIQLAHYLLPRYREEMSYSTWKSSLLENQASDTTYKAHTAYTKKAPAKVSVYIGDNFEVAAYSARGDGNIADLYAALEALDFVSLEKMISQHQVAKKDSAVADAGKVVTQNVRQQEPNEPPKELYFGKMDCDTFNSNFKKKMQKEMNSKFAPWVHLLQGKEASTAEIEDDEMVFPKKGNDWLQCVKLNDILWSPWDMPMFTRRVKAITDQPDRVIFKTENSGLDEVILQGRVTIDDKEDVVKEKSDK